MLPPFHHTRRRPPPDDLWWQPLIRKSRIRYQRIRNFLAANVQALADTMTFTQVEDQGANLLDTITFSHTFGSPEQNASLSDTVRFGGNLRIDTTDLAGGRYRY